MHHRRQERLFIQLSLIMLVILLLTGFFLLERNIRPVVFAIAEQRAQILATRTLNQAVNQAVVQRSYGYDDLMRIEKNSNNAVSFMEPNWMNINRMRTEIISQVQQRLGTMEGLDFQIPLGQVFGSYIFATEGPDIGVEVIPIGVVRAEVNERFEAAGINQTRHVIFLSVETDVRIVIPLYEWKETVKHRTVIAETVIVGPVPDTYVNFNARGSTFEGLGTGN